MGRIKVNIGYNDANWAKCAYDKRSSGGYVFRFCSGVVSWSSNRKQPTIVLSIIEAKYREAIMATCEISWLCKLLHDLGLDVPRAATLYCDNMSNI